LVTAFVLPAGDVDFDSWTRALMFRFGPCCSDRSQSADNAIDRLAMVWVERISHLLKRLDGRGIKTERIMAALRPGFDLDEISWSVRSVRSGREGMVALQRLDQPTELFRADNAMVPEGSILQRRTARSGNEQGSVEGLVLRAMPVDPDAEVPGVECYCRRGLMAGDG
jgi:hypothetical protein